MREGRETSQRGEPEKKENEEKADLSIKYTGTTMFCEKHVGTGK